MAWQLHYTSARRGPTGRAGFQFVAETPGLPDGVRAGVTPHLSYRPPPDAPPAPRDAELDRFPVAFLYDRVDGRPLLLRCRYLGRDYSGRYGNFFAHAVVAEPAELEGLRPAELWHAPLWAPGPAQDDRLAELEELTPDDTLAPEALARWLASSGPDAPHRTLALLIDAAVKVLEQGHGRLVLIADHVETIARWIALITYSLPVDTAARLTFTTYSADPDAAAQSLVGTTTGVWSATRTQARDTSAVNVEYGFGEFGTEPSLFGRIVAACWRRADFAGLDCLGELALLDPDEGGPAALERAAALVALGRRYEGLTAAEEDAAAVLLSRRPDDVPEWLWEELAPSVPVLRMSLLLAFHDRARRTRDVLLARRCAWRFTELALREPALRHLLPDDLVEVAGETPGEESPVTSALAAAGTLPEIAGVAAVAALTGVRVAPAEVTRAAANAVPCAGPELKTAIDACPGALRGPLMEGVVTGLARRAAADGPGDLHDPDVCDLLYDHAGGLGSEPDVAIPVLASVGRRRPDRRIAVTRVLLTAGAPPSRIEPALAEVWAGPPTAGECLRLLEAHAAEFASSRALAGLPSRTFGELAHHPGTELGELPALRLAARVRELLPDGAAARDAAVVQAYAEALAAGRGEQAARALAVLADPGEATARVADGAFAGAVRSLTARPPHFRSALLAALPEAARARVGERWITGLGERARAGRSPLRPSEVAERNDLVEVVLRMRRGGAREPGLERWAAAASAGWLAARQIDSHLAGSPGLREELRTLRAEGA
ncbi:hypothetical protein SAMN04489713_102534 [Actinomadura madurae]|uniref:Uncharacterized protein n=1 Tax=Actinomadura madurae TaxID=1993 RepID=A0A1I5ABW6_9ACTN|nr:hypothetical protein [Actinomadura madurae]SFN59903.1 hypothetical protein SAMN04489713_102534 [Actinomadura madurae]